MGCIITRDFDYAPPPNLPPSVEDLPTAANPMSRVIEVRTGGAGGGGDAGASDIVFEVIVRDPNIDQVLDAKIYVDFNPSASPRIAPEQRLTLNPEQDDDPVDRVVTFRLPTSLFAPGSCHRIELLVAQDFQNEPNERQPAQEGDLGVGVWWLSSIGAQPVDMATCPE